MARHLIELIGTVKLAELEVRDVDFALGKAGEALLDQDREVPARHR